MPTKVLQVVDFLGAVVVGTFKKVFTIMLLTAILASLFTTAMVLLIAKIV